MLHEIERFKENWKYKTSMNDLYIIYIECPWMSLLGCKYHLRLSREEPKTGWYKDGKFMCKVM